MKRYIIFAGETHYPGGGFHDYLFSSDNLIAALVKIEIIIYHTERTYHPLEWWHIFDTETSRIVEWSDDQGYGADVDGPPKLGER